jgi:hypothetical protein
MSEGHDFKATELTDEESGMVTGGTDREEISALSQCPVCLQWFSCERIPGKPVIHYNCPGKPQTSNEEKPTNMDAGRRLDKPVRLS